MRIGKTTLSTCKYIVASLPNLTKVTLTGTGITDFSCLTSSGFKNDGNNVFTKQ